VITERTVENTIQRLQYFAFWRRLPRLPSSAHISNVCHVLHTQTNKLVTSQLLWW